MNRITLAAIIAATAFVAFGHVTDAQVPACLVEGTPVPCPTATPVPPTATPTPTPFPLVAPQVRLYQSSSCGNPTVQADFIGGNTYWRVIITRNGLVANNPLDLYGTLPGVFTDTTAQAGSVYRAYAFPRETAPIVVPGTLFDASASLFSSVVAAGVAACVAPAPPTAPVSAPAVASAPSDLARLIDALRAPILPRTEGQQAPASRIAPPSTGSAGLLP